ncbi:type II toxin-antitoxin system RelE/ParE family toxin [Clostridium sporogenes]|uniref:type II toxin-antitoxin system RelE/ParE family toxin n=1 Tax=Clostridium sporogenes TaxID=1509 RepID=UPI0013D66FA2|nr:type II toxin-antitoxin system RelE/ParE family toxin [Clostridium sporogenes]NFD93378.1 hypothetical protein [Clostridium sporogenes]NFE45324.1 hypothetical protein [Clostridium sporogenes]NFF16880.1 hypothetical protein [Clostridium sporogenes]NFF74654.1 hypothetical protein [Clostridium sporogenes]NFF79305.1 hypothetical protein [Clostridium sporogenes]
MLIGYSDNKVQKLCLDYRKAKKEFGDKVTRKLYQRLGWISAADNLNIFNCDYKFLKLHKLSGNYENCYAINITEKYRLIFYPCDEDGNLNKNENFDAITLIIIEEVSNHYGD